MSTPGEAQRSFLDAIKVEPPQPLSEDDAAKLGGLEDEFYAEYGKLVARFLDRAPSPAAADSLLVRIADLSNPFSSCWDEHAKVYRPITADELMSKKRSGR